MIADKVKKVKEHIETFQEKRNEKIFEKIFYKLNDSYKWNKPVEDFRSIIDKAQVLNDCMKNLSERSKYGVGHRDAWSLGDYLMVVIANGLRTLARDEHGWPGTEEFPTIEVWENKLVEIANALEATIEPYEELIEYKEYLVIRSLYGPDSEKAKEASKNWLNAEAKQCEERTKIRKEALAWIANHCDNLWD